MATRLDGSARHERVRALEDRLAAAERHAADLTDRLADSEKRYRSFLDVLDALRGALPLDDVVRQLETQLRSSTRGHAGTAQATDRGADGAGSTGATGTAANGTVLIVTEQNSVRLLVHRTLQAAGYKVLIASSGAEAVVLAEHTGASIDVLLTDVAMPGMSGRQLADRLSQMQPGMRVLFMSACLPQGDLPDGGVTEADIELLETPLTAESLLPRLRQLIRGS